MATQTEEVMDATSIKLPEDDLDVRDGDLNGSIGSPDKEPIDPNDMKFEDSVDVADTSFSPSGPSLDDKDEISDAKVYAESFLDPKIKEQQDLIKASTPTSELEIALNAELHRKESQIERLTGEVVKLKAFISKRKQTYKRKRKDEGAPTRALSAYNIFVQDRFSRLAKENEAALNSADTDAKLKRVPPASLVASTGNQWKELSAEEKNYYEER